MGKAFIRQNKNNNILIVDDDEGICKSLKLILNKKGYKVDTAMSGRDAVERMKNKLFDVVVLDIKLPDIEGTELISSLKKINQEIAIIIITAYASLRTAMRAIDEGVNAYVTKPFNIYELLDKIRQALRNQKKRKLLETTQHKLIKYKQTEKELLEEKKKIENLKIPYKLHIAIKYLEQNYQDSHICVKDIASVVKLNPKTLLRLWNLYMEQGIKKFLNDLRIEKAQKLLLNTTLPISQVAKRSGFSKEYFCTIFKSKTDQSPMKYRKLYSKK